MSKGQSVVGDALLFLANSIRAEDVIQLAFDPHHAKRICGEGLSFLDRHRAALQKEHPNLDLAELDALPELCDRISRAQRETDNLRREENPARELTDDALEWRRRLLPLADSLAASHALDASVVDGIRAGRGVANQVQDVIDLTLALEPHEAVVAAAFGKGALEKARKAADAAIKSMGARSQSKTEASVSADLRDRYATMVIQRHDRLRVVVALVSSFKKAQRVVAGLRGAGRRKAKTFGPPVTEPVMPS